MSGQVWLVNKRKRGGKKVAVKKRKSSKRKSSSSRRRVVARKRSFKRNPSSRINLKNIGRVAFEKQIKPAAIGAAGAIAMDAAYGFTAGYLPDMLTTGPVRHLTKGVMAIAASVLVSNFLKSETANKLAEGSLTVTLHDAGKELLANVLPEGALGYFSPAVVEPAMLGYYAPAQIPMATARLNGIPSRRSGMGFFEETENSFDTSTL